MNSLRQIWSALPFKWHFGVLFIAWVALFHFLGNSVFGYVDTPSLYGWLWGIWHGNEDDEVGMLVPILVLGLLWMKREELIHAPKQPWTPALLFVALGALLHFAGYTVQQTRISGFGFLVGMAGIIGLVWGRALLSAVFFPFFLLLFALPFSSLLDGLTFPLRMFVTGGAVGFCNGVLDMGVIRKGTMLFNAQQTYRFDVAAACSGIHSLTAMLLLSVTFAFLNFHSPWRRILLISSAIPLAILGNVLRLITVIVVSDTLGQAAGVKIENRFGFVTFLFGLLGVLILGYFLRERRLPQPALNPSGKTTPPPAQPQTV